MQKQSREQMSRYSRQELIGIIIRLVLKKIGGAISDLESAAAERVAMVYIENGHSACRAIEAGIKAGRMMISNRY